MTHELLADDGWTETIELLGGEDLLTRSARETKAFLRPQGVQSAPDLLRLTRGGFSTKIHLKTPNAFIWTATHYLAHRLMLAGFFASVGNNLALRLFGHTRLVLQRFLPVTKMSSPLVMVGPRSLGSRRGPHSPSLLCSRCATASLNARAAASQATREEPFTDRMISAAFTVKPCFSANSAAVYASFVFSLLRISDSIDLLRLVQALSGLLQ
ncbi:hypothetical protein NL532_20660 [Mesorhizobium sp. C120A]|uniref:hypothetical protein n=1 Tax=unclassified Mesorhizobium TaxID=325217 RepID=UPI0003D04106|nr:MULTISPECIES: hypothetical protein [unclassified Mesorhizobium]ESZ53931.1 hypothetical protein X728_32425 [Mesorhizobium sp. L103C120A0]WJI43063.1 hypothetical protein NL532_20660 [Mesorhizobium sp. C120A]